MPLWKYLVNHSVVNPVGALRILKLAFEDIAIIL